MRYCIESYNRYYYYEREWGYGQDLGWTPYIGDRTFFDSLPEVVEKYADVIFNDNRGAFPYKILDNNDNIIYEMRYKENKWHTHMRMLGANQTFSDNNYKILMEMCDAGSIYTLAYVFGKKYSMREVAEIFKNKLLKELM